MAALTLERLDEILDRARSIRAVVVGDLMLDVYLTGTVARISPEAPVPVVHVSEERNALGGAANVAANVARLGAECEVVGVVGRDAAAADIRLELGRVGRGVVHGRLVERTDRPTTTKTRVMARRQQVVRFDRECDDELPEDCIGEICVAIRAAVASADVVVLEDYDKGVLAPGVIRTALAAAAERGMPVVVDPKLRQVHAYRGATLIKPNALELAAAIGGRLRVHDDDWLEEARRRLGCEHLLVTLGEEGMALRSAHCADTFRIPAVAREVFDVSGAGDTVAACTALALAAGATVREAAVLANVAAGIEVGKPGVATVGPEELRQYVEQTQPYQSTQEGRA